MSLADQNVQTSGDHKDSSERCLVLGMMGRICGMCTCHQLSLTPGFLLGIWWGDGFPNFVARTFAVVGGGWASNQVVNPLRFRSCAQIEINRSSESCIYIQPLLSFSFFFPQIEKKSYEKYTSCVCKKWCASPIYSRTAGTIRSLPVELSCLWFLSYLKEPGYGVGWCLDNGAASKWSKFCVGVLDALFWRDQKFYGMATEPGLPILGSANVSNCQATAE